MRIRILLVFFFLYHLALYCAPGHIFSGEVVLPPRVIYMVMTDRFYDGDLSNDVNVQPDNMRSYHGGDFTGLIQKLGYIKSLGVTDIWITPVYNNRDPYPGETSYDYHGCAAVDFEQTDEHLGSWDDLSNLVEDAHKKGLRVLIDVVVNHSAPSHPFVNDPKKSRWFHPKKGIVDWNDQNEVEKGEIFGLPDFAQENPEVSKYLIDVHKKMVEKTKCDGFRVDTVKHVPHSFWRDFSDEFHKTFGKDFFLVG